MRTRAVCVQDMGRVDRGRRWEEIKILKHCTYTCCGESHAAASFDFGHVASMRRTPATSRKAAAPRHAHTAAPGHSEARRSNRWRATEAGMAERIRSNARHPERAPCSAKTLLLNKLIACYSIWGAQQLVNQKFKKIGHPKQDLNRCWVVLSQ